MWLVFAVGRTFEGLPVRLGGSLTATRADVRRPAVLVLAFEP